MILLRQIEGPEPGKIVSLEFNDAPAKDVILGRGPECDMRIANGQGDLGVSRRHCRLHVASPWDLFVCDLKSTNGTFVNGQPAGLAEDNATPLGPGDILRLGEVVFRCEWDGVVPAESVASILARYNNVSPVGQGASGMVHQAMDPDTAEPVALKAITLAEPIADDMRRRLLREAHLSVQLAHRNIVRTHRCWRCPEGFVLAMEFCPGGTLADRCAEPEHRPDAGQAVRWTLDLLGALDYAHNASFWAQRGDGAITQATRLVHRDVSPMNVLFAADGTIKLADFGMAKSAELAGVSLLTQQQHRAGRPRFLPQQMGRPGGLLHAGPEVDVWAAAAVLYWMLSCTTPRRFSRREDPWLTLSQTDVRPIRSLTPAIPDRLADVIDEALIDTPDIRIKTASQLRDQLRDAANGL